MVTGLQVVRDRRLPEGEGLIISTAKMPILQTSVDSQQCAQGNLAMRLILESSNLGRSIHLRTLFVSAITFQPMSVHNLRETEPVLCGREMTGFEFVCVIVRVEL